MQKYFILIFTDKKGYGLSIYVMQQETGGVPPITPVTKTCLW